MSFVSSRNADCRKICQLSAQPTAKGQLISKANCQAMNSSKKRMNELIFTTMRRVFVRFFGRN